jgi:hypothetical protein
MANLFSNLDTEDSDPQQTGILLAPKSPKVSVIKQRLINTSIEVQEEMAKAEHASFLFSALCQVGMPRSKVVERYFERRAGNISIRLDAGVLFNGQEWVDVPLPYGSTPRLVMIYLCSEAIKTGNPCVDVGRSLHDFMQILGKDTNGTSYAKFRKQIESLAACHLAIGIGQNANASADQKQDKSSLDIQQATTLKTSPIEKFNAWVSNNGSSPGLWEAEMQLSEPFFKKLLEHAVPIDSRVLASIKHSPLAIDIYTWLTYRLRQINDYNGVKVSWQSLKIQFGQEYKEVKDFTREFKKSLNDVLSVYFLAKVEVVYGGIKLYPSCPSVPRKSIQNTKLYP